MACNKCQTETETYRIVPINTNIPESESLDIDIGHEKAGLCCECVEEHFQNAPQTVMCAFCGDRGFYEVEKYGGLDIQGDIQLGGSKEVSCGYLCTEHLQALLRNEL